jgi:hypothetical protein
LLVAAVTCAYKATMLGDAIAGWSPRAIGWLVLEDLPYLGTVGVLCLLTGLGRRAVAWTALGLLVAANLAYMVDTWALLTLNHHLTLGYVVGLLPDAETASTFLTKTQGALLLATVTAHAVRLGGRRWALPVTVMLLGVVGLGARNLVPEPYRRYRFPEPSSRSAVEEGVAARFAPREIAEYRAWLSARPHVHLPRAGVNLVLVIVESLSTTDSARAGGFDDRLPTFDALADEGILFPNMIANYDLSEGGIIALLSGIIPVPFPRSTRSLFTSFRSQGSVVQELAARGYQTRVISAFPKNFQQMTDYLDGLGVHVVRDRDDHPVLAGAPRFVLDAPSDAALYDAGLHDVDELRALGRPYLLVLMTATSHPPWTDPRGRSHTEDAVWRFVDAEIGRLYRELRARRFFDNGILIVTGDHRKHSPVSARETKRFGARAAALTPLLVVGAGIPARGVDGRFVQQADLFRVLGKMADPQAPLSPAAVMVRVYTRGPLEFDEIGRLAVFLEAEEGLVAHEADVHGAGFAWRGTPPPGAAGIEQRVQAERAVHQDNVERTAEPCELPLPGRWEPDGDHRGLLVRHVRGGEGSGDAVPAVLEARLRAGQERALGAVGAGAPVPGEAVEVSAYLRVERAGEYWFRVDPPLAKCVAIDGVAMVSGTRSALDWDVGHAFLHPGSHRVTITRTGRATRERVTLLWRPPGGGKYERVPDTQFIAPRSVDAGTEASS